MNGKENIFLMNCIGFFNQSIYDFFTAFIDYCKIKSLFSVINDKKRKLFIVLNERFFQMIFIQAIGFSYQTFNAVSVDCFFKKSTANRYAYLQML